MLTQIRSIKAKNNDATKKRLLKEADEMANGLRNVSMISMAEWREIDALCLSEVRPLPASKIKKNSSASRC